MERLRGARGRLPPGGLRAPPGRRAEGAFPGAGRGRQRALGFGALRSAWPTGTVLAWSLDWGRAAALGCARGSPGRGRSLAGSLALVSRPPAGRGAPSRAGSAGNWPPVGDICIARPRPARPARPHPQGGTRPAAVPPPLHLSAGWARCSQAVGQPAPGKANLHPAPPPWLRGRRPRPAPALSLRGYTAHTAPGVYPGTQLPGGKGRRAREQEAALTCAPPAVSVLPTRCPPRLASREPRSSGPRTARAAQQVAVQPLGRLTLLDLSSASSPGQVSLRAPSNSSRAPGKLPSSQPYVKPVAPRTHPLYFHIPEKPDRGS